MIIGIDIGGTYARIGAVEDNGTVYFFEKVFQNIIFDQSNLTDCLVKWISAYMEKYELGTKVQVICICLPAMVESEEGLVIQAPNISMEEYIPIGKSLAEHFDFPIYVERDVNGCLIYDIKKYKLEEAKIINGFYVGTGLGNAITIDGHILRGKNGMAGELGHIPVLRSRLKCNCGNVGCIEMQAGGKVIKEYCNKIEEQDIASFFIKHGKSNFVKKYTKVLAHAIAVEVNIFDPEVIIISGGVPEMNAFPREKLENELFMYLRKPVNRRNLRIIWAEDDECKGIIGAALLAKYRLNNGELL